MLITITGVPISVNHCYFTAATGRRILTKEAAAYIDAVGWATKAVWLAEGQPDMSGELALEFHYYFPDKRRRDLDNTKKLLCDGISAALGVDDSRFLCRDMERSVDNDNPRVEIKVVKE